MPPNKQLADQLHRQWSWIVISHFPAYRRIDDGERLCKDLILLVQERANIEKEFAKQLKSWSTKWNSLIEKGNNIHIPCCVMNHRYVLCDKEHNVTITTYALIKYRIRNS